MIYDPDNKILNSNWAAGVTAATASGGGAIEVKTELADLRRAVGRLNLLNQALWELLQKHLPLTDEALLQLASEIDLRDGKADGQLNPTAVRCPKCERICNSRHQRCLYCGQAFAGDLFISSGT